MIAGSLELQLFADVARLRQDMEKATGIVSSGANAMARAASMATAALGALGVGLSVGALAAFSRQIINSVDAMNDLADATGASIENIRALDGIARRTGASFDTVGQALIKYNQALGGTIKPGTDAEAALKALGLNAKALRQQDPAEALRDTAVALAQFADDGAKARVVQELFGKSLREVAPFLKDLAEAGRLQASVSRAQAEEAERFNKHLFEIQANSRDAGRAILMDLLPSVNKLLQGYIAIRELGAFDLIVKDAAKAMVGLNRLTGDTAKDINNILAERDEIVAKMNADQRKGFGTKLRDDWQEQIGNLNRYLELLRVKQRNEALAMGGDTGDALSRRLSPRRTIGDLPDQAALKKAADEAKRLREEEEKFRIKWGREDAIRQGESVIKRNEEEAKALTAAIDGLIESRDRQFIADAKVIKSAEDMVEQAQFELSLMGLSNVEREKAIALRQLEATGIDKASLKYAELAEAIGKTITDRAAMQKQIDDFQNVWNSIDRTAQQTFTNIFEGGQDAFTKLRDTLKATLLDLLYQMTVRKWVFNLAANVTGASSGAVGAVANSSGLNSIGGLLGNFSGMSMANTAGSMFANATGGGLDALLATNGAFGTAAGGAGIMGTLSAALPWVGGALAIASLLDKPGGGPKTIGGASDAATIQATVQATLAQFGIRNAGLRVGGFSAADPRGDSLTQLQTALFQGDRALYSRQDRVGNYENVGRSSEELAAAWAEETARITLAALKNTLEPKYQQYLREVDANTSDVTAINAALTRLTTARTLEERLLELSSTEAENLARARARELDAMDETLRPLLRQIQAQEDLKKRIEETNAALLSNVNDAYEAVRNARSNEVSQLDSTVTRLRDYGRTLREFRDGLLLGSLSTLTPGQRLEEARRQLDAVASKARTGDQNAQGQVQGLVSAFLEASATYNASGAGFTSDFAYTQQLLTDLSTSALAGADVAQLQLDALGVLNQSVLTIPTALTSLATAITTAIGAGLNPGAASIGALAGGVTGQRVSTGAGSVYASTGGAASLGNTVYTKNGKTFTLQELQNELIKAIMGGATSQDFATASAITGINRADALAALAGTGYESRLPAFRNGGMHSGGWAMVGEGGPELAYMPPSRIYSNSDTRQMLDIKPLVERIKSLEGTVQQLGQALVAATYDATDRAAGKTVDGVAGATSRASFAAQTVPVLA